MSVIADLIRAGVDADLVARVADEITAAAVSAVSSKRSKHAEAQARYHAKKVSAPSELIISDQNDQADADCEPKKEMLPTPLERKNPPLSKENPPKGGQKKGSRLPTDWRPSALSFEYGLRLGFIESRVWDMAEDMRLWAASASGKNAIKLDWDAALCGWMRREKSRQRDGPKRSGMDRVASIANGDFFGGSDERFDSHDAGQGAGGPVQGASGFGGRLSERDRSDGGPFLDLRPAGSD